VASGGSGSSAPTNSSGGTQNSSGIGGLSQYQTGGPG
jgi:hypothetical protein